MDNDERLQRLHNSIQAYTEQEEGVEGAYLRHWIIIADWVAPDGSKWLSHDESDDVTPWELRGMVDEAMDMIANEGVETDGD